MTIPFPPPEAIGKILDLTEELRIRSQTKVGEEFERAEAAERRVAEVEKVLEPFAQFIEHLDMKAGGHFEIEHPQGMWLDALIDGCRKARAALASKEIKS